MSAASIEDQELVKIHKVEHIRQRYNWDCGVSCVLMVLDSEQRSRFLQDFTSVCAEEGFGHSTWTIDLCYLLKRFSIRHDMFTTALGVREEYRKQGYYKKIIDIDVDRVERRFSQACSHGLRVCQQSVRCDQLEHHLRHHGPVIVLVDAGLLVCDLCKHNKLKAEFRRCFGGEYKGHYILLVGFNSLTNKLIYRDPALSPRLCALSRSRMQEARSALGTDDDCILVYTSSPSPPVKNVNS